MKLKFDTMTVDTIIEKNKLHIYLTIIADNEKLYIQKNRIYKSYPAKENAVNQKETEEILAALKAHVSKNIINFNMFNTIISADTRAVCERAML